MFVDTHHRNEFSYEPTTLTPHILYSLTTTTQTFWDILSILLFVFFCHAKAVVFSTWLVFVSLPVRPASAVTYLRPAVHLHLGGASTTSSQIYLSRGVAGTKSEPALPILDIQVASFVESSTTQRLSLTPSCTCHERMSHTQDHAKKTPLLGGSSRSPTISQHEDSSNTTSDVQPPAPRRSEVLRHVFPRPSRSRDPHNHKNMPRVAKADCPNTALVSRLQSRPRVAFHRYITSFFGGAHDRNVVADLPKARSRASSFGSRPGSSLYGSVPSLDVISPTAFMFSGPSLRSAGSHSDSLSRLPSLAETNSDVQLIRRARTDSFSMLDSSSVTEDAILEPGVDEGITRTVNDVLLGVRTPTERDESSSIVTLEDSSSVFSDTQEHVVRNRLHSVRNNSTSPVCTFAALLSPYLDTATWSALRLTNRAWYLALSVAAPPTFPSSYHLPVEILHHVYDYLSPKDFNAVRHTCQHWMRASLDKKLLTTMLRRGGWLSGAEDTNCRARSVSSHPIADTVSQSKEWLLSRHLSRQCALSSGWTGNGLDTRVAITERSEVDFSELANGYAGGLVFATSLCSRFVCVARETLIYIYDLDNGVPVPITSVICPRRVLEVSMDVSSGRHAIAALLEGRMGLVCELHYGRTIRGNDPVEVHVDVDGQEKGTASASIQTSCVNDYETGMNLQGRSIARMHRPFFQERDPASFDTISVRSNNEHINLHNTNDCRTYDQHFINHAWNLILSGPSRNHTAQAHCISRSCLHSVPVETGTTTIYRHLCAEDDPPRSISICPQRRCVAFGCSAGIELHWIDALTGQSLSR